MKTNKEIIRFIFAGAIVNATDFSVYYILLHFLTYSISKGISFTCAGVVGYLLNKFWTFKHRQRSYSEIVRYVLASILALGINVLTNQTVLNIRPGAVILALIIATVLRGIFAFVCFKWWVFRTPSKDGVPFAGHDVGDFRIQFRFNAKIPVCDNSLKLPV